MSTYIGFMNFQDLMEDNGNFRKIKGKNKPTCFAEENKFVNYSIILCNVSSYDFKRKIGISFIPSSHLTAFHPIFKIILLFLTW